MAFAARLLHFLGHALGCSNSAQLAFNLLDRCEEHPCDSNARLSKHRSTISFSDSLRGFRRQATNIEIEESKAKTAE